MHPYSTDENKSYIIYIIFFILSIFIYSVASDAIKCNIYKTLFLYLSKLNWENSLNTIMFLEKNSLIPVITVTVIYQVMIYLYKRVFWRYLSFLHNVPNINGQWKGTLTSSATTIPINMILTVKQDWDKISFISEFVNTKDPNKTSRSYSNTAAIYMNDPRGKTIYFGFHNTSNDTDTFLQQYDGYNILILSDDLKSISATYFNNRPNPDPNIKGGNIGIFKLQKITNKS